MAESEITLEWASPEDAMACERDRLLYGIQAFELDENGRWRHVPATTLKPAPLGVMAWVAAG